MDPQLINGEPVDLLRTGQPKKTSVVLKTTPTNPNPVMIVKVVSATERKHF